jgi:hypothetical protein
MAGGAAVWCWCDVLPVCCCPVLYSYVGRGGVRSPTGAGIIGPARGGGGARPVQRSAAGGRGIIGPAWPVRGDLSSGAGCCCPLLYSYVGRGGVRSPTGAGIIGPARGGGGARPVQRSAAGGRGIIGPAWPVRGDLSSGAGCCCPLLYSYVGRGGVRSPTGAGIIGPARGGGGAWPVQRSAAAGCDLLPARHHRAAHGKAAHGKRATKKR